MQNLINEIAMKHPGMSELGFIERYTDTHPKPEGLSEDNLRQAYAKYNKHARRIHKGKAGVPRNRMKRK